MDISREQRERETAALMARAQDPNDSYDGHHGNDRSGASVEFAREYEPELAVRIEQKIAVGANE